MIQTSAKKAFFFLSSNSNSKAKIACQNKFVIALFQLTGSKSFLFGKSMALTHLRLLLSSATLTSFPEPNACAKSKPPLPPCRSTPHVQAPGGVLWAVTCCKREYLRNGGGGSVGSSKKAQISKANCCSFVWHKFRVPRCYYAGFFAEYLLSRYVIRPMPQKKRPFALLPNSSPPSPALAAGHINIQRKNSVIGISGSTIKIRIPDK